MSSSFGAEIVAGVEDRLASKVRGVIAPKTSDT